MFRPRLHKDHPQKRLQRDEESDMQLNQPPTKILQAASPVQDLHISHSYFCFCFHNIGLYFYVFLRGSPTHPK